MGKFKEGVKVYKKGEPKKVYTISYVGAYIVEAKRKYQTKEIEQTFAKDDPDWLLWNDGIIPLSRKEICEKFGVADFQLID